MSTVIQATKFVLEDPEFKQEFITAFIQSRGKGMSTYLAQVPLYIVNSDENLANRGCINYAI